MDVIITLMADNFSRDFSLPANVKLKDLCPRLLNALQSSYSTRFSDWKSIVLETDEGALADYEATLADYGICTGKYLYLSEEVKQDGI